MTTPWTGDQYQEPPCSERGKHNLIYMSRVHAQMCQFCNWNFYPKTSTWMEDMTSNTQLRMFGEASPERNQH